MLSGIEALVALEKFGTVSEAATRLRLTQSAVSKRIHALQAAVGYKVIAPQGRRVRITDAGMRLLERARPLVAELRALAAPSGLDAVATLSLALADSIAGSWGPAVVRKALASVRGVAVELHAHRSVLLVESLRLGRYHVGLTTDVPTARDLIRYPVIDEPLVVINARCSRRPSGGEPLLTIEADSATWRALEPQLRRACPELLARQRVGVESFGAVVQMARAGYGDGLVPLGLAREMKVDARCYRSLGGVARKVVLFTRKTVHGMPGFQEFREALTREAAAYLRAAAQL